MSDLFFFKKKQKKAKLTSYGMLLFNVLRWFLNLGVPELERLSSIVSSTPKLGPAAFKINIPFFSPPLTPHGVCTLVSFFPRFADSSNTTRLCQIFSKNQVLLSLYYWTSTWWSMPWVPTCLLHLMCVFQDFYFACRAWKYFPVGVFLFWVILHLYR